MDHTLTDASKAILLLERQVEKSTLALEDAIRSNDCIGLKQALNNGANPNYTDKCGNNFLLLAARKRNCLLQLLSYDVFKQSKCINHQNKFGQSILMRACYADDIAIVRELINIKEINFNLKDNEGNTAAHYAFRSKSGENKVKIVTSLANCDADFTITNKNGITPAFFLATSNERFPLGTLRKIMSQQDSDGNTQLHLLAKAETELLIPSGNYLYSNVIKLLKLVDLGIWNLNNHHQLPIDLVAQKYNDLHSLYTQDKSPHLFKVLTNQEKILHELLKQHAAERTSFCITMCSNAQEFNLETYVVLYYIPKDSEYYEKSIEERSFIKLFLLTSGEFLVKWVSPLPFTNN